MRGICEVTSADDHSAEGQRRRGSEAQRCRSTEGQRCRGAEVQRRKRQGVEGERHDLTTGRGQGERPWVEPPGGPGGGAPGGANGQPTTPGQRASAKRCYTNGKRMNNDRGRACGGFISPALEPKTTCRAGAISTPNLSAGNVSRPVQSTPIWRAVPAPRVHCGGRWRAGGRPGRWARGRGGVAVGVPPGGNDPPGRSPDAPRRTRHRYGGAVARTAGPPRPPARRPPGVGPGWARGGLGGGGRPAKSG